MRLNEKSGRDNMAKRWTLEEIRDYADKNTESKLLSTEYRGFSQKLEFECACGNHFEKTFTKFKNKYQNKCEVCQPPKSSR